MKTETAKEILLVIFPSSVFPGMPSSLWVVVVAGDGQEHLAEQEEDDIVPVLNMLTVCGVTPGNVDVSVRLLPSSYICNGGEG